MEYTKGGWKLTNQERAECDAVGCSRHEVQEAKKRAYIANGGVILNPDALEDMYEALKLAKIEILTQMAEIGDEDINPTLQQIGRALAKANGE